MLKKTAGDGNHHPEAVQPGGSQHNPDNEQQKCEPPLPQDRKGCAEAIRVGANHGFDGCMATLPALSVSVGRWAPEEDAYRCPGGSLLRRHMTIVETCFTLHRHRDRASCQARALNPSARPASNAGSPAGSTRTSPRRCSGGWISRPTQCGPAGESSNIPSGVEGRFAGIDPGAAERAGAPPQADDADAASDRALQRHQRAHGGVRAGGAGRPLGSAESDRNRTRRCR